MKIGIDIDNVLSNFNEILLNDYLEHDKVLNNSGIIHKDEYIRKMFDWDVSYEQEYYKNNIERLASFFTPIEDSSKYINKLTNHCIKATTKRQRILYNFKGYDNFCPTYKDVKLAYMLDYIKLFDTENVSLLDKADITGKNG